MKDTFIFLNFKSGAKLMVNIKHLLYVSGPFTIGTTVALRGPTTYSGLAETPEEIHKLLVLD